MRDEKGLSESTIASRCWFVHKFLDRIVQEGQQLGTADLKEIDAVLAWQGSHGYTTVGVSSYANALRAFF